MEVMSALRKLILHNVDNEENKKELAKFAKNYLPILFNLYTTESTENRRDPAKLAALETVKIYLQITDKEVRFLCLQHVQIYILEPMRNLHYNR
jgi:ribosomal RNA-processing protein 12